MKTSSYKIHDYLEKMFDALIGRSSKTGRKLSMLINLAVSRIAIIKNLHSTKFSQAETDVIELLQLGYQERALTRVELLINEQNTLDAYVLIENYCRLLAERTKMIKNTRECPDELKEAVSTLVFAASRCGEFPELQEIRLLFTSVFGKEFVRSSTESRHHCQVSPKMVQMFSMHQPSLETKQKLLKQIAKHNGITLHEAFDVSNELQRHGEDFQLLVDASFEARKDEGVPIEERFGDARSRNVEAAALEASQATRVLTEGY